MALAILALSYRFPNRSWRRTLSMAAGQMTAMLLTGSSLSYAGSHGAHRGAHGKRRRSRVVAKHVDLGA